MNSYTIFQKFYFEIFGNVTNSSYLCTIQLLKNAKTMTEEEKIFAEKADNYLVCFNSQCPLHDHCLRWRVTPYISGNSVSVNAVNPHYEGIGTEQCFMYRSDQPVRMPVGLVHIYHDMPGRIERSIKNRLIATYSRKRYYEYHNGKRPLTPDVERFVRQVCRANGWTEELTFGGYVEEYVW